MPLVNLFFQQHKIYFLFITIGLNSWLVISQDEWEKKRITDKEYKYEFFVSDKKTAVDKNKTYYWFKGGAIHNTQGEKAGLVLNNTFEKFYLNGQLAEKGKFKKGLKVGLWITWYENGKINTTCMWSKGQKKGWFYKYDNQGTLIEKGRYHNDEKKGYWTSLNDNKKTKFKKGKVVPEKKPDSLLVQKTTNSKPTEKIKKETKQKTTQKKATSNIKKKETKEKTKASFWSKLFKKKEKNDKSK